MMDFLTLAKARYSCRSLTDQPVSEDEIASIIKSAVLAPTAHNYQPFKIWVMESEEALAKVKSACPQPFIKPCPVVFVVGADTRRAWVRDYDGKNFAEVDASIAATHILLEVQALGLATTWIGHFDPAKIKAQFPEMNEYSLIAVFAVGHPSPDAVPAEAHDRFLPEEELVQHC